MDRNKAHHVKYANIKPKCITDSTHSSTHAQTLIATRAHTHTSAFSVACTRPLVTHYSDTNRNMQISIYLQEPRPRCS